MVGRSVLSRDFRLHNRHPTPTPARPQGRDGGAAQDTHTDGEGSHLERDTSASPVDRPLGCDSPSPERSILEPGRHPILSLPRDSRQAMAQPVHVRRRARVHDRTQPTPATEAEWDVSWYFNVATESLPLILQLALLLLGCALSRYLWTIDCSTACVILAFTSLGMLFYLLILVAGSIYESCPYQTPCSQIIRHIQRRLPPEIRRFSLVRALRSLGKHLFLFQGVTHLFDDNVEWWKQPSTALLVVVTLPILHWIDTLALIWALSTSLGLSARSVYTWILAAWRRDPPLPDIDRGEDYEIHLLDSHCVAWMLDTSMD